MTPLTNISAVLERFLSGQCRRRARTMGEVLGQFRKRDGRRAYFAVRHKQEQRANVVADATFRARSRQQSLRFK